MPEKAACALRSWGLKQIGLMEIQRLPLSLTNGFENLVGGNCWQDWAYRHWLSVACRKQPTRAIPAEMD